MPGPRILSVAAPSDHVGAARLAQAARGYGAEPVLIRCSVDLNEHAARVAGRRRHPAPPQRLILQTAIQANNPGGTVPYLFSGSGVPVRGRAARLPRSIVSCHAAVSARM